METADAGSTEQQQSEKSAKMSQLYLLIISRYKNYIEEREEISVAELPGFVMPAAPLVSKRANSIKEGMGNYIYENNFRDASMSAFDFVRGSVNEIEMPLQFWLNPEETLRFMGGDITDRSILLCSLLIALGNPSAKVIVLINEPARDLRVYYEFNGSVTAFDIMKGETKEFKTRDEMLESFSINENTTAYEFNDQMYVDIG